MVQVSADTQLYIAQKILGHTGITKKIICATATHLVKVHLDFVCKFLRG